MLTLELNITKEITTIDLYDKTVTSLQTNKSPDSIHVAILSL